MHHEIHGTATGLPNTRHLFIPKIRYFIGNISDSTENKTKHK